MSMKESLDAGQVHDPHVNVYRLIAQPTPIPVPSAIMIRISTIQHQNLQPGQDRGQSCIKYIVFFGMKHNIITLS